MVYKSKYMKLLWKNIYYFFHDKKIIWECGVFMGLQKKKKK